MIRATKRPLTAPPPRDVRRVFSRLRAAGAPAAVRTGVKDVLAQCVLCAPCPSPKVYCPGDSGTWNRSITEKSDC